MGSESSIVTSHGSTSKTTKISDFFRMLNDSDSSETFAFDTSLLKSEQILSNVLFPTPELFADDIAKTTVLSIGGKKCG